MLVNRRTPAYDDIPDDLEKKDDVWGSGKLLLSKRNSNRKADCGIGRWGSGGSPSHGLQKNRKANQRVGAGAPGGGLPVPLPGQRSKSISSEGFRQV